MQVPIEDAYTAACQIIGEQAVTIRILQQTPPPEPPAPPSEPVAEPSA